MRQRRGVPKAPFLVACLWLAASFSSPGPVRASCECVLVIESAEFSAHCYQTCSDQDSPDPGNVWRRVTECHSRALRFAANLRERLEHDAGLRRFARQSPLTFGRVYGWSDTLGLDDWQVPSGLASSTVDSLLGVFREIDQDTSATLFVVQLGVFKKRPLAESLWRQLDDLRPSDFEGDSDVRDSTSAVDWRLSTCSYTARPNLFIWPTSPTSGPWRVYYGLFVDRGDAERMARRLRGVHKLGAVVHSVRVDTDLLQSAISQWHLKGMSDTN